MAYRIKCPECGNDMEYVGKAGESFTAHGHHGKKYRCNNSHCEMDEPVVGGF